MSRIAALLFVSVVVTGSACKGTTVIQDNPKTLEDLNKCKSDKDEQAKLIKDLETAKTSLEMAAAAGAGSGVEVSVAFENDILTVHPAKPGEVRHLDDKAIGAAAQQFVNLVASSKGAIQKCYEAALKKDTSLQAKSVRLMISASFNANGSYKSSSTSPSLGDAFDSCMRAVASKWQLPPNTPTIPFRAPLSLNPS